MRRARLLVFCVLALALPFRALSQAQNTPTVALAHSSALNPPPIVLFLTPDHFAMIGSERRILALVDDLARSIPASSWTVSDPTVAQITPDGGITALTPGKATITATYENLAAAAELTVYASRAEAAGKVRWSVQPLPGNTFLKLHPALPVGPDDPGVYFVERSGSKLIIRSFTSDGRQKWIHTILPTTGTTPTRTSSLGSASLRKISITASGTRTVRPHRWGKQITEFLNQLNSQGDSPVASSMHGARLQPAQKGLLKRVQADSPVTQTVLALADTDAGNQVVNTFEANLGIGRNEGKDNIVVLDASGKELWRHSIVGGEMGFALHPDGIVYIVQADYLSNSTFTLLAVDELTGTTKFSIQLPPSLGGQLQPLSGLPSVLPDGNLYLPVETLDNVNSPDVLRILKVSPDGTYSWIPVASATECHGPVIFPHEAIPDGQGGVLVTWEYVGAPLCVGFMNPVQLNHLSASGQTILSPLPLPNLASYFSDNDGDALLGKDHFFVADNRSNAVGFNLSTSSIDLNWQASNSPCATSSCPQISLLGAASGDRLIVTQTGNSDGSSTLFVLTPSFSDACPTACAVATSVPDYTLVAFDFSGTRSSSTFQTFISTDQSTVETFLFTDQYFFVLPTPSARSRATATLAGAVTPP